MRALPEPNELEMAVDAGHVATFEAAIVVLASRYVGPGTNEADRVRWEAALTDARSELAGWRRRPSPKVVLD